MEFMKNRFIIHTSKMLAGYGTFLACMVLGGTYVYVGRYMMSVSFFLIALLFLAVGLHNSSMITIEDGGIRKSLFGKTICFMPWSEVKEVGVAGTKVFGATEKKTGKLFIYISEQQMTDEDHFKMILEWPPREQLYLEYAKERIHLIQLHWKGEITTYQTGKLTFS